MSRTNCHLCGSKLVQKEEFVWHCSSCKSTIYANPKPCVDLALFNNNGEVLVAKRGREPYKGKHDLPGGFVDCNETYEQALLREAKEELGVLPKDITAPRYVTSYTFLYPFGKEVYSIVVAVYCAKLINSTAVIEADDDVESVEFRAVDSLIKKEFSSPDYLDVIRLAHQAHQAN